ncbi:MAG: phosphoribosylglycinamide formyltransferase [Lachnospiraceae bacterium]|nr:phosphoribosylglycinamide formyltransferase [Lachnospiraceae bacterium]
MTDIVVLVSGGGTNLQAIIDAIESGTITNARVKAVISNKEDAYALERAKKHGIKGKVAKKAELLSAIKEEGPDLLVLAGFLVVLPEEIIREYENRIINIHPSLIPSFCGQGFYGLRVHEGVLSRGCKVTGATVHFVDEGTDTGPIIIQKAVEVLPGDTPEVLQKRVMEEAEWKILPKAIDLFSNGKLVVKEGKVEVLS